FSHLQRSAQRFGKQLVGHFMYPRRSHLFWIAIDEGSSLLVEIDAERLFDQRLARPQCRQVMLAITKPDDAVLLAARSIVGRTAREAASKRRSVAPVGKEHLPPDRMQVFEPPCDFLRRGGVGVGDEAEMGGSDLMVLARRKTVLRH